MVQLAADASKHHDVAHVNAAVGRDWYVLTATCQGARVDTMDRFAELIDDLGQRSPLNIMGGDEYIEGGSRHVAQYVLTQRKARRARSRHPL